MNRSVKTSYNRPRHLVLLRSRMLWRKLLLSGKKKNSVVGKYGVGNDCRNQMMKNTKIRTVKKSKPNFHQIISIYILFKKRYRCSRLRDCTGSMRGGISLNMTGQRAPAGDDEIMVVNMFPSINKKYLIASSIKIFRVQTVACGWKDQRFHYSIRVSGSDKEMVDLSSLSAGVKTRVRNANDTPLWNDVNITLIDEFLTVCFIVTQCP